MTACSRSATALAAVGETAAASGGVVTPLVGDAAEPGAGEALVAEAAERHGDVDVLVYAAGVHTAGPFEATSEDDWRRLFDLNLFGAVRFSRAVLPAQRRLGRGRIIVIASTAGLRGTAYQTIYNASKHALVGLARSLAIECAAAGVTVNAICPGFVDTPMTDEAAPTLGPLLGIEPDQVASRLVEKIPLGRMIEPREVADLACFLAGEKAAGLTGQALVLDGGMV